MGSTKGKIKVKASAKRRAVKPTLGKGSGGLLSARIVAVVRKRKEK